MSRRSNNRAPEQVTSGKESPQRVQRVVVIASVLSFAVLLGVYLFLPQVESPSSRVLVRDGSPAAEPTVSEPLSSPASSPAFSLPEALVDIDTESEQQRLLKEVEDAVQAYPTDAKIHYIAALTYKELLQTERANDRFKRSLELEGDNADALVAYTDMLIRLEGKHEQAVALLSPAVDRGVKTDSMLVTLGEAYSELGELEKAVHYLEQALALGSQDPQTHVYLSQNLIQLERFAEAEQQARTALAREPSSRAAYIALSTALIRQDKKAEALEIRAQIPKVESQVMPDDQKYKQSFRDFAANSYSMLGAAYISHADLKSAERSLVHSLKLTPTSVAAATLLAELLRRENRIRDSMIVYQRLTEIQPSNPVNFHNLASLALTHGDVQLVEQTLRRGAEADPSGNGDLQLAKFLLALNNAHESARYAQRAVDRLANVDAYLVLIAAHRARGDKAAAFSAYRKAKDVAPGDPRLTEFGP